MRFKEIYNALPKITARGKRLIEKGIAHVEKLRAAGTDEEKKQGESAIQAGLDRIDKIESIAHRIRSQLRVLAALCYDGSIPMPKDLDADI